MDSGGRGREWWAVKEEGGGRGHGMVSSEGGGWSGGVGSSSCPPFMSSLSCCCPV